MWIVWLIVVCIIHLLWRLLMLWVMLLVVLAVLVVLSASVVMMHPLPCRQMTAVHHAGVGEVFQTVSECRGGLDVCRFPGAQAVGATRRSKWVLVMGTL